MHTFYNSYRIAVPRKMHGPVQDAPAPRERPGASITPTPSPMCISCNSKQVHELTKKLT